jgi:hypothetical protein
MKTKVALESDQHKESAMNLTICQLTPDQWPALEDLFGEHGIRGAWKDLPATRLGGYRSAASGGRHGLPHEQGGEVLEE